MSIVAACGKSALTLASATHGICSSSTLGRLRVGTQHRRARPGRRSRLAALGVGVHVAGDGDLIRLGSANSEDPSVASAPTPISTTHDDRERPLESLAALRPA